MRAESRRSWLAVFAQTTPPSALCWSHRKRDRPGADPFGQRPRFVDSPTWAADAAAHLTDTTASVDRYLDAAAASAGIGVLVPYAIPLQRQQLLGRRGFTGPDAYRSWIRQVRAGVAGRPVAVMVEPDAVTSADCLPEADRIVRPSLLRFAVRTLAADPGTAVYFDGGHSLVVGPRSGDRALAGRCPGRARGFSLNVSNFFATGEEIAYGEAVSGLLGGAHYVIDTSRATSSGRPPRRTVDLCNPPGRALGDRHHRRRGSLDQAPR